MLINFNMKLNFTIERSETIFIIIFILKETKVNWICILKYCDLLSQYGKALGWNPEVLRIGSCHYKYIVYLLFSMEFQKR